MPQYVVESISGQETWEGKFGPMISYSLVLKDVGAAELNQKPTSPPPAPGQVIEGTLEPPKNPAFPPKLKKAQGAAGGGGGGGGFKPRSPEDQRMIVHQHSQTAAIQFFAAKDPKHLTLENVKALARALTDDVTAVARDVPAPPKAQRDTAPDPSYSTDVPANTDGLGDDPRSPEEKAHDEAIPF